MLDGIADARIPSVPMVEQLPARYAPAFTKGCINATLWGTPVRLHGAVERDDRRKELYRAAFIRSSLGYVPATTLRARRV